MKKLKQNKTQIKQTTKMQNKKLYYLKIQLNKSNIQWDTNEN